MASNTEFDQYLKSWALDNESSGSEWP